MVAHYLPLLADSHSLRRSPLSGESAPFSLSHLAIPPEKQHLSSSCVVKIFLKKPSTDHLSYLQDVAVIRRPDQSSVILRQAHCSIVIGAVWSAPGGQINLR